MARLARHLAVLLCSALAAGSAWSDLFVVVNTASGVTSMTRDEVINVFLGRFRQLPSGLSATPLDLPADHPARARFYRLLVDKEPAEIGAYWARLVFSGRTLPPRVVAGEPQAVAMIAADRQSIGYLPAPPVDPRLRVVFRLSEATPP